MTRQEFLNFIKGKTIEEVELDTIDHNRGGDLFENVISINSILFTDGSKIEMVSNAYVDKVFCITQLHGRI